jgi:hypothetical protein
MSTTHDAQNIKFIILLIRECISNLKESPKHIIINRINCCKQPGFEGSSKL